jgi:hypothetical protein
MAKCGIVGCDKRAVGGFTETTLREVLITQLRQSRVDVRCGARNTRAC